MMAAPKNNQNAKKERTRIPACLSISDDKGRLSWAISRLQAQGIEAPTDQQISRFVKDWCYERIDEEMSKKEA